MARKFQIRPTILGSTNCIKTRAFDEVLSDADVGKGCKLVKANTYGLCAAGDVPEAFIVAIVVGTQNGQTMASIRDEETFMVTAGATCAVGDFVKIHSVAALNVSDDRKQAIVAPHTTPAVGDHLWRIVSADTDDTVVTSGDTQVVIERV